ncbi:hypothetical protein GCM10010428_77200 [Actinosynnema pretiosum subsp. pretiosum]
MPTSLPSASETGRAEKPWSTSSAVAVRTVVPGSTETTGLVITSAAFMAVTLARARGLREGRRAGRVRAVGPGRAGAGGPVRGAAGGRVGHGVPVAARPAGTLSVGPWAPAQRGEGATKGDRDLGPCQAGSGARDVVHGFDGRWVR